MKQLNNNPTPVTVWDIEKKRPIGVFKSCSVAARYLFPLGEKMSNASKIDAHAMRKTRVKDTVLGTVAVRYSTDAQKEILKSGPRGLFFIYEGYPNMDLGKFVAI